MAKERGLSPQTIMGHLASAMEAGHFVDYRRGTTHCHCIYNVVSNIAIIAFLRLV